MLSKKCFFFIVKIEFELVFGICLIVSFGIEEEDEVVGDAPSAGGNQPGAAGQNVAAKRTGQNPKAGGVGGLLMLDHGLVG